MLRMLLACAVIGPSLLACAPYSQINAQSSLSEPSSVADAICVNAMGLWTGEVYYPRCEESVADILAARTKRQTMLSAFRDCKLRGLNEDTPNFSFCMMNSKPAAATPLMIAVSTDPDTEPGIRFDYISPAIQVNRERYACAQLGLLPGSDPFDDCVYSLKDALIPNKY